MKEPKKFVGVFNIIVGLALFILYAFFRYNPEVIKVVGDFAIFSIALLSIISGIVILIKTDE